MKLLLFFLTALLLMNVVSAEDTLSIDHIVLQEGQCAIVDIRITNESFGGGQVCMQWDDQVINLTPVNRSEYGYDVTVKNRDNVITYTGLHSTLSTGFVYSRMRICAIGSRGDRTELNIFNAQIISTDGVLIPCNYSDGSVTIRARTGDLNLDGVVNILDVVYLLNHMASPATYPLV